MSRGKPYSEKFKILEISDCMIMVHVVEDLNDDEIVSYYHTAIELEHFDHAFALNAEGIRRGIKKTKFRI